MADGARLHRALDQMAGDPFSGDIVRLKGHRFGWRRRVGDYRILYDLDPVNRVVAIGLIARCTTSTYRKR